MREPGDRRENVTPLEQSWQCYRAGQRATVRAGIEQMLISGALTDQTPEYQEWQELYAWCNYHEVQGYLKKLQRDPENLETKTQADQLQDAAFTAAQAARESGEKCLVHIYAYLPKYRIPENQGELLRLAQKLETSGNRDDALAAANALIIAARFLPNLLGPDESRQGVIEKADTYADEGTVQAHIAFNAGRHFWELYNKTSEEEKLGEKAQRDLQYAGWYFSSALERYEHLGGRVNDPAAAHGWLSRVHFAQKRFQEALAEAKIAEQMFKQLSDSDPDSENWLERYQEAKEWREKVETEIA